MKNDIPLAYLKNRISVDCSLGVVYWIDATKYHHQLNCYEAGCKRKSSSSDKFYWHVKIDRRAIKRSHLVFLFANGRWPKDQIDHINGDSTDDRIENLREVNQTQNAWNHKKRAKHSDTPMGVRKMASGKFQVRIACNGKKFSYSPFDTEDQAANFYQQKRKELYGAYS